MDDQGVPGYFLQENVKTVKKEKGPEGVKNLQKLVPQLEINKISPFKKYLISDEVLLLEGVAKVLY